MLRGALPASRDELCAALESGRSFTYVCFYGHKSSRALTSACFSQWIESPFTVDGITYPTAEHFMMAEKARLFQDDEILADILGARDPATAKAYGRSVRNFDDDVWCRHRFDIVVRANVAKFGQNAALQAFLLGTRKHVLVEASPRDRIWGIGLSAKHQDAETPHHWLGLNLLGFALMTARAILQSSDHS